MNKAILAQLSRKTTFINDTTLYKSTIFIQALVLSTTNALLLTKSNLLFPDMNQLKEKENQLFISKKTNIGFISNALEVYDNLFLYKVRLTGFDMVMIKKLNEFSQKTVLLLDKNLTRYDYELSASLDDFFLMGFSFKIYGNKMINNQL